MWQIRIDVIKLRMYLKCIMVAKENKTIIVELPEVQNYLKKKNKTKIRI